MCVHPRCGNRSVYQLTETLYGDQCFLCERHAIKYQKSKGGKLIEILTGNEDDLRKDSDEGISSNIPGGVVSSSSSLNSFGWREPRPGVQPVQTMELHDNDTSNDNDSADDYNDGGNNHNNDGRHHHHPRYNIVEFHNYEYSYNCANDACDNVDCEFHVLDAWV